MFGYVKIYRPDLRIREYEAYRGLYCGICKAMGKTFGQRSRLFLSYDSVLPAMLAADSFREAPCFRSCRCPVHPLEKRTCACESEPLRLAGGAYLLLLKQKLLDDRTDSGSLLSRLLLRFLAPSFRKAERLYPKTAEIAERFFTEQQAAESDPHAPLDAYAEPSARAMARMFALLTESEEERRILERTGYMLGRWVYLLDAADDLEKDRKRKRFNPFLLTMPGEITSSPEAFRQSILPSLERTRAELAASYSLMPEKTYTPILRNIFELGLPAEEKRVLQAARKGKKDDRSL